MSNKTTSLVEWMNERAHEEVRTDDYGPGDAPMAVNTPHPSVVNYSPSAEVTLKCANNEKEQCHQECANEEHWPPTPLVNI